MPRTEGGFSFGECGINPQRITTGLTLRKSKDGQHVLAVAASRCYNAFFDLGHDGANNCMHVNPLAGNLPPGGSARLSGSVRLLNCSLKEAAQELSCQLDIPIAPWDGLD